MKNLPPNFLPVQQGTPEWLMARVGCVTASRVKDVLGTKAAREKYKLEILTEILTGLAVEHYVSQAMDFGTENEGAARGNYEIAKGCEVELVGLVMHPGIKRAAASPDGLVGEDGLVEFKVPNTTTHLGYLLAGAVPSEYKPQMLWQMACTDRTWCDFVSYDPRLPSEFGLFIVRFDRDRAAIEKMEREVELFMTEVNEMAEKLLKHKGDGIEDALKRSLPQRGAAPPAAEIPQWIEP